ncbi:MAG TPA: cation:proton antiporter [Hyphomicrobiaceae bacterium]|nr:cation:proton antiporter [Hyphomicrobiaceae bacterium]
MASAIDLASYKDTLIVLGTTAVVVPLMHKLRITPALGYLAAGALLGPSGLGQFTGQIPALFYITIAGGDEIVGIAELGVVFLLFVIGLELSYRRLVTMHRFVFGLGVLQVLISALVIGLAAPLFGHLAGASLLIGMALALSSTAVVLEWLSQRRRLNSLMGRAAFGVLLLQDLAVVPVLILVEMLGTRSVAVDLLTSLALAAVTVGGIVALGQLALRPMFRMVAATDSSDVFMAATLLVAIGTGVVAAVAGLSMALGGFLAGLLLAETEYRRAIETAIEPFKGLLLGVFFISVGLRIDLAAIANEPLYILASAAGLIAVKAAILTPLARLFGLSWPAAIEVGLLLGPGGEFAFIVLGMAMMSGIISFPVGGLLLAVVALSMGAIPLLGWLGERIAGRLGSSGALPEAALIEPAQDEAVNAIVVGGGRVGKLVSELLARHGVTHLLVDRDPAIVAEARQRGHNIYYGDAKNPHFLKRCGIAQARALIVSIAAQQEIDEVIAVARGLREALPIVARARDANHARHLYSLGVVDAVPETIEASLQLSEAALVTLGVAEEPVIASIHEKRDELRRALQQMSRQDGKPVRALRSGANE